MTYAWNNHSTQNAHIKQMRDDRQKAYMETHRGNKAYDSTKSVKISMVLNMNATIQSTIIGSALIFGIKLQTVIFYSRMTET